MLIESQMGEEKNTKFNLYNANTSIFATAKLNNKWMRKNLKLYKANTSKIQQAKSNNKQTKEKFLIF